MHTTAAIDLCMPFWGDPQQLFDAVRSVQAQHDPHWRLTVIDDCYPDPEVARWFAGLDDERIRYRRNERNVGITENFRKAIEAAQGEWVAVLGGDDLLLPDYVGTMRRLSQSHPDVDVVQAGVEVIDERGAPVRTLVDGVKQRMLTPRRATTIRGERLASSLLHGNWLYWPSLLLRTSSVRRFGFRDDLPIILDLALLIDLAFDGASLLYDPERVFRYRRHTASLSQTALQDGSRFEDERRFYRDAARRAAQRRWHRARLAASIRLMSRLHAITVLPTVLRRGSGRARRAALALALL